MSQQLACTYAALILSEVGKSDAHSILAVTKAGGIEVSHGMASAFADALGTVNIADVLGNIAFSGGAPAAAGAAPAAAHGAPAAGGKGKKEEKKVEEEEADDDMGFGLFD